MLNRRCFQVFGTLWVLTACGGNTPETNSQNHPGQSIAAALVDAVGDGEVVRGAAVSVRSQRLGYEWQGAEGLADPEAGVEMTVDTPVRIASNTKTFVAVAMLRLVELKKITLDDPLTIWIDPALDVAFKAEGYDTTAIQLRHLLTHTAGLYDHSSSPKYETRIVEDPMYHWTADEQIRMALAWGDPLAGPGEIFSYCDTGYILLGEIIERVTGKSLAAAVRELCRFESLGLKSTWWETQEPAPPGIPSRAHQYLGDLDTATFHPAYDLYGGGGLVSTVGDLTLFTEALMTNRVFDDPKTLTIMLSTIEGTRLPEDAEPGGLVPGQYRMGLWAVEIDGLDGWRHTGFFGTSVTWIPELELAVAVTVNQNRAKDELEELARIAIGTASE